MWRTARPCAPASRRSNASTATSTSSSTTRHPEARPAGRLQAAGLGRHHRHQPDGAVPRVAGGAAGDDRAQERQDHPHRVADERPRRGPRSSVHGGEGRRAALTRGMAVELAPHNIQVNAIAPGYLHRDESRADRQRRVQRLGMQAHPAGRWATRPRSPASRSSCLPRRQLHHRPVHRHGWGNECGVVSGKQGPGRRRSDHLFLAKSPA